MHNTRPQAASPPSPGEPRSAGQFSRWGPPTGIAGALASSPGGGLRPASRGSAKPAPTTQRYAHVIAAPSSNPGNRVILTAAVALFAVQKNLSE